MSPFPVEPARALGPMRLVLTTYPSREAALTAIDGALSRRLVACASLTAVESRYWWEGRVERSTESLVLFKTVPKRVGALFRYLKEGHPYKVPEIVELDVPRAEPGYLAYLVRTLDRASVGVPSPWHARRRGGRRAREAPLPPRTRGTHHLP